MLQTLKPIPADPILAVMAAFARDTNPRRVDLGVGVYKTEQGATPIPAAVQSAAQQLASEQQTKVYVGQAGNARFNQALLELTLGGQHAAVTSGRARALQAPGGCGALRVGAELLRIANRETVIHVSTPTWANHVPLLGNAGLQIQSYPYFDRASGGVQVGAMLERLDALPAQSVVLLHGCCHNPTGADLSRQDWVAVTEVLERRRLVPFVDMAYQGLGEGLDADAFGARLLADRLPEMLIAVSCSKNFGLYRERVGSIMVICESAERSTIAMGQMQQIARGMYSMPPDHGAELVARVCENPALRAEWSAELEAMRRRLTELRSALAQRLTKLRPDVDHSFLMRQRGLFSLLPLTTAQIDRLRGERHIYMPGDGRINVAGISLRNVDYLAESLATVI